MNTNIIECDDPENVKFIEPDYKMLWLMTTAWLKGKSSDLHTQLMDWLEIEGICPRPLWFIKHEKTNTTPKNPVA